MGTIKIKVRCANCLKNIPNPEVHVDYYNQIHMRVKHCTQCEGFSLGEVKKAYFTAFPPDAPSTAIGRDVLCGKLNAIKDNYFKC